MQHQLPTQGATIIKQGNKELFIEGKAKIYTKYVEKNQQGQTVQNGVFYNPVQIFNRDCTILAMQTYINMLKREKTLKFDGVGIVDALSASGLRTIRFLKQLQGLKTVYANDISPASHKLMRDNFDLNNLDETKLKMTLQDANSLLQNPNKDIQCDIIDLDPYGSVIPFLQSSIQAIRDGGLLCITCTDTKVTCGPDVAKCYYFYGTTRAKVQHFSENALRIVLSSISSSASRHCKFIEPLFSFQTDFYLRVFVRVRKGKKQCTESAAKIGNAYNCNSCGNYQYQPFFHKKVNKEHYVPSKVVFKSNICSVCDEPYFLNGPIWLDSINNQDFIKQMLELLEKQDTLMELKTKKKIYGTLHAILAERELSNFPLGFCFDLMCKNAKSSTPNKKVLISAAKSLGFEVVSSYISPGIYKTNAGIPVIYDIIKSWKKNNVPEEKYLDNVKEEFTLRLLKKQINYKPDFDYQNDQKEKYIPHFISMGKNMGPKGKPEKKILQKQNEEVPVKQVNNKKQ